MFGCKLHQPIDLVFGTNLADLKGNHITCIENLNPYHAEGYSWLVSNYATHYYSHDQSKCSTMPSVTIVT